MSVADTYGTPPRGPADRWPELLMLGLVIVVCNLWVFIAWTVLHNIVGVL